MRHVIERELTEGIRMLRKNGFEHSISVESAGPLTRTDGVEYLARSIPEDDESPLPDGAVIKTKYGLCAIVS